MPHDHGHSHPHSHDHAHGGGCGHGHHHHHVIPKDISRRFVIGAVVNCVFVVAELTAGFITGSLALIADALHNFSDVVGLLLAWAGLWLSRLAPTLRRTYGYRSASYLTALANAGLLLFATGAMAWESFQRFATPAEIATGPVMIVGTIAIIINFGTAMLFHSGQKADLNIRGAYLHMMADAALSLGVVVAAGLMALTGWLWLDPAMGLVISLFIIWATLRLAQEALDMALAAVPSHIDPAAVGAFLREQPGVTGVHDLHIWPMSTEETALTAHVVVRPGEGGDAFLQRVSTALADRFRIGHATIQIENDPDAAACQLTAHTTAL